MRKAYHKYIVKSHLMFIIVVSIFTALFLFLSLSIKVSVIETLDGTSGGDRLIINQIVNYPIDKVYVYQDRSEKIIPYTVLHIEYIDGIYTVLYINKNIDDEGFEGVIKIDAEKGRTSLLSVVLGFKKRYVEDNLK